MEKIKISRFEFAIMEVADPIEAANYEPFTEQEELQQRRDKLLDAADKLKINNPS